MTAQAMTSSSSVQTMPPWATASQPWKRGSSVVSVHDPPGSVWIARWRPCSLSSPQAKHRCGSKSKAPSRSIRVGRRGRRLAFAAAARLDCTDAACVGRTVASDVKVADLARLGLDEFLARLDLLAHQLGEDLIGVDGVVRIDVGPK